MDRRVPYTWSRGWLLYFPVVVASQGRQFQNVSPAVSGLGSCDRIKRLPSISRYSATTTPKTQRLVHRGQGRSQLEAWWLGHGAREAGL